MKTVTPREFYDALIRNMPMGLERALLRALSYHVGKENAIDKPTLLFELKRAGFPVNERQARAEIVELRKHGHLICSSSGEGGYFIAGTLEEYAEFAQVEYRSKITDMSSTLQAMDEGARALFHGVPHVAKQESLF